MATFRERTLKSGAVSITAQIQRKNPKFHDSQSGFTTMKAAKKWAAKREKEIDQQIANGVPPTKRSASRKTLADAITLYIQSQESEIGKTKTQVLRTIKEEYDISRMACDTITAPDLADFAREIRNRDGVNSPATVNNYMQHLSAVFTAGRVLLRCPLDEKAMKDAMKVLTKAGTVAKAAKRERRPTLVELDTLMQHFINQSAHDPRTLPMHYIVAFAIFSTRRQAEICRIEWRDYEPTEDANETRVLVRDLKHPGDKRGNDTICYLADPCRKIIAAHAKIKKDGKFLFPYNSDTISRRFTQACKLLEIEDLHFHDLRHEGTSRLFEMDWNIPRVSQVTGHRSWESLKRYAHIRAKGDIYENWKWMDAVT